MALDVTGPYRYPSPDPAWLDRRREEALDPDLLILDPHHHLWEQDGNPYLLDEIAADMACGHRVIGTVFVQAHYAHRSDGPAHLRPVGETERVAAIAAEAARRGLARGLAAGIVAHADLRLGDRIAEVLEAHAEAAQGRLRGIRQSVARDEHFPQGIVLRPAARGMLAEPAVRAALARIARDGLGFDAMIYHAQLPELAGLAAALPDLPIVLDHLGCPLGVGPYAERPAEVFEAWRRDLRALARHPRVDVKLGGLGMIITGARWHERAAPPGSEELAEAWRPWVETAIEAFGPERCMFESNFPVDKAMAPAAVLWNAFKRIAAAAAPAERAALFHGTALRSYRLPRSLLE